MQQSFDREGPAAAVAPAGDVDIAYETFGDPAHPPVLLIMGAGAQLLSWPEGFCWNLVDHDLFVVRFDNRDVGLSTHLTEAPLPDLAACLAGDTSTAAYTLSDMATDTIQLIDHLGLESAHLVGLSMGGMIAQVIAIEHPEKVRSLTSLMSSTGNRDVGKWTPETWAVLATPPSAPTREAFIERDVLFNRTVGSPDYPSDEVELRRLAGSYFDRAFDPLGGARQLAAALASGDRTEALARISAPTLVIHGAEDKMLDVTGGHATAEAIPGAELVIIPGMGHDLPGELWAGITDRISRLVDSAEGNVTPAGSAS